jgi:hypothetical protein
MIINILLLGYSIIGITHNFYVLLYNNKADVTVTKFNYENKNITYKFDDNNELVVDYYIYTNVDCIITFDKETNGYITYDIKKTK